MKQYSVANQMTLVGKAWEIRHQLKMIAKQSPIRHPERKTAGTLGEYLEQRRPRQNND